MIKSWGNNKKPMIRHRWVIKSIKAKLIHMLDHGSHMMRHLITVKLNIRGLSFGLSKTDCCNTKT